MCGYKFTYCADFNKTHVTQSVVHIACTEFFKIIFEAKCTKYRLHFIYTLKYSMAFTVLILT
jgi:hypothetical protein